MKRSRLIIIVVLAIVTFGCKESNKKEKVTLPEKQETVDKSPQVSEEMIYFAGVWSSPEQNPIVELTIKNGQYEVRECYGLNAKNGVLYNGIYKDGNVVAIGNEKDFYKWTLPIFKLSENMDTLTFISGAGPFELIKTEKLMPNITYNPPKNND